MVQRLVQHRGGMVMHQWGRVHQMVHMGGMWTDLVVAELGHRVAMSMDLMVRLVHGLVASVICHTMADVVSGGGDGDMVTGHGWEWGGVGELGGGPGERGEEGKLGGGW